MSEAIELRKAGTDPLELDLVKLGRVLSESGFFADSRDAAKAIVKVLAGRELGVPPIAAMKGVYIVQGKVTLAADLIASLIKKSGRYDYRVREHDSERCSIEFFDGSESIGTSTFTMADAKDAGLLANPTWKKYPRNMVWARAMSNGARWYCPDVFNGAIYTAEEMGAKVDEEGSVVEVGSSAPEETPTSPAAGPATSSEAAPSGTKEPKKATAKQLSKLAVLASNFGWSDEERRERAGVASFTELTFDQASTLIEAWEADETSGGVVDPGKEPVESSEDVEGAGGEANPPASGQPPAPSPNDIEGAAEAVGRDPLAHKKLEPLNDDQPATTEHLNRLSDVFGGASKALLAARQMFGPEITSVSMLTTGQATKLFEEKLPS